MPDAEPGRKTFLALRELLYASMRFDDFLGKQVDRTGPFACAYAMVAEGAYAEASTELGSMGEEAQADPTFWLLSARCSFGMQENDDGYDSLTSILGIPDIESRLRIQVWSILREFGYHPEPELMDEPLGVVVEMGLPQAEAVFAGYADGSCRLFWSTGGGQLGNQEDTPTARAAAGLVEAARGYVIAMDSEDEPACVLSGRIQFAVLTPSGAKVHDEGLREIGDEKNQYHPLFAAANALLTQLRKDYTQKNLAK